MLPLALAILGVVVPLVGSDFAVWELSALWVLVIGVVMLGARVAAPPPADRVVAGIAALPMLFLLAFEGGWWFIPAVVAKIAIDIRAARVDGRARADVE